jgi:hypothetical protein
MFCETNEYLLPEFLAEQDLYSTHKRAGFHPTKKWSIPAYTIYGTENRPPHEGTAVAVRSSIHQIKQTYHNL